MQFYKTYLLLNISSKTLDIKAKELKSDYGDFDKESWERITLSSVTCYRQVAVSLLQ